MKTLGPALLLLEAIVVALAIPVALVLDGGGARAAWTLGILAILLVVAGALQATSMRTAAIATGTLIVFTATKPAGSVSSGCRRETPYVAFSAATAVTLARRPGTNGTAANRGTKYRVTSGAAPGRIRA